MKNNTVFANPTKVITGVVRLSYANIWQAKSINGGAPKFSTSVLISKDDKETVDKIKAAIKAAYEEGESKLKGNGKTVPTLRQLKIRFVTEMSSVPMMKPTPTVTSSTQTATPLPVLSMPIAGRLSTPARFTPEYMPVCPSRFMHLTATAIKASPAVCRTFRKSKTVPLLRARPKLKTNSTMTFIPMPVMTSLRKT